MNRIVNSLWESKTDIGGSIFDLATSYELVLHNKIENKEDREQMRRFNVARDLKHTKPHKCQFIVWMRSLSLRYLIEAGIFMVILIIF